MVIRKLMLQNFRLFSEIDLSFTDGINLITGKNGQGKTSILESIHYLALTKSFRTTVDKNAIKYDESYFNIRGHILSINSQQTDVRVYYSHQDAKQIFIDEKKVAKFSDYLGTVPCVVLTPDDLKLSYGSPGERRRFLDVLLSQVSSVYLDDLKNYRRALQQRNALLANKDRSIIKNQIEIWNMQLIKFGVPVIKKRLEFIRFLNEKLTIQYQKYSSTSDTIAARYKSQLVSDQDKTEETEISEKFLSRLNHKLDYEMAKMSTETGPHRDDIDFYKNKKLFKEFGSQGENKTLIIVLKFLEWEYLSRNKSNEPVLLLDDIFGELDETRMHGLLYYLKKIGQAFITTTIDDKFTDRIITGKYQVKDGKIFDA